MTTQNANQLLAALNSQNAPKQAARVQLTPEQVFGAVKFGQDFTTYERLPYPEPGRYPALKVLGCKTVTRRDMVPCFIVEFEVVEQSTSTTQGRTPHPKGAKFAWVQKTNNPLSPASRFIIQFASAALGVPTKVVALEHMEMICDEQGGKSPGGPLAVRGVCVQAEFFLDPKQHKYVNVRFTSAPGKSLVELMQPSA
jgi:hypothetical protein